MFSPTRILDCVGFDRLAAGWTFYSSSGSKLSFHYIFGELKVLEADADNADLVSRTFVAYDEPVSEIPQLVLVDQLQTPDGLRYFIYEQLWCLIGKGRLEGIEAAFAAS